MINYQDFAYNGSKITFSKGKDVYVCATQMAKPFGKRPNDWLGLQSTKDFLSAVSVTKNVGITELVITRRGNSSECKQGTWIREDVAMEFARWLSPMFAIWCNDRIKELLTKGKTELPKPKSNGYNMPVPTEDVTKDDTIMMHAQRMRDKDYSISDVAGMIVWGKYHIPRRTFVGYLYEHGFLRTHETGVAYPTEMALALGLFCVVDKCKRGAKNQLKKPRVRITMDGANYFINVLQHGLRGVYPANRVNQGMIGIES